MCLNLRDAERPGDAGSSVPHPAARSDPGFTLKMRNAVWASLSR
jgi:hypothetical protein